MVSKPAPAVAWALTGERLWRATKSGMLVGRGRVGTMERCAGFVTHYTRNVARAADVGDCFGAGQIQVSARERPAATAAFRCPSGAIARCPRPISGRQSACVARPLKACKVRPPHPLENVMTTETLLYIPMRE